MIKPESMVAKMIQDMPKFDGSLFNQFKDRINHVMRALDLIEFIEMSVPKPVVPVPVDKEKPTAAEEEEIKQANQKVKEWEQKRSSAWCLISTACDAERQSMISGMNC